MNEYLLALLREYNRVQARVGGTGYRCLDEDGSPDDAMEVTSTGDEMVIRIQGPMDGFYGVSARRIIAEIDDASPSAIRLLIDSPGGFVSEGMSLYSDLRARSVAGTRVSAEARGIVASAAVLPFVAADERIMGEGSMLMVHNVWGFLFAMGDADLLERESGQVVTAMRALSANYASSVAGRTGMTQDAMAAAMDAETWYDAAEAVAAGYAQERVEPPDDGGEDGDEQALVAVGERALAHWRLNTIRNANLNRGS